MRKGIKREPFTWVQGIWLFGGIILLLAGFHVINVPDNRLLDVAWHLGLAMFTAGIINLIVYFTKKPEMHGSHWVLADGLSTALLSVFPLFNQVIIPMMIPFFFGIWELFSGVLKFIDSTELHEEGVHGWQLFFVIGAFELASGVASLIKPIEDFVGMNHVIAIILFVQACGFFLKVLIYHRLIEIKKL